MSGWTQIISDVMSRINTFWDATKKRITEGLGIQDPIRIMPYRGYGTPEKLYLKGRVLQDEEIKLREENASVWKNLRNMFRRFESDEIPKARLQVNFKDLQQEVIADEEGFFEVEIQPQTKLNGDRLWQNVHLELLESHPETPQSIQAEGEVIVVSEGAKFGVISDIDDTIMHTGATDLLKMIRIAYLGNERTRRPFAGVPAFYQALQQGQSGSESNPIFYVSSSAWNMYDLFVKFMDFNDIPHGPLLLRDIELSPANLLSFEHKSHKIEQIAPILERFSHLPFILIGDSGQKDAEIYRQIVRDYPERIQGIYIHDVTPNDSKRKQELSAIAEEVQETGCEYVVFSEMLAAANHAAEQGWIAKEALQEIERD
jgi:phosphatidate phosphatase APP1